MIFNQNNYEAARKRLFKALELSTRGSIDGGNKMKLSLKHG